MLLVSLLSLGWRVGIVVAAAVPLTLAVVFVIMLETGRFFDRITLGALILALGLLVDDAIIAIEMMVVKMEEGMDRIAAAAYAWSHTAAPMLSGTLVTVVGLMPVGFARSTAGEYAGNIFWIVGFALIASWVVAVAVTPYLGVKLLPEIKPVEGGHHAIYDTPNYRRLRRVIACRRAPQIPGLRRGGDRLRALRHRHGRGEAAVLPDLRSSRGAGRGAACRRARASRRRSGRCETVERWLADQPEAQIVTSYIGQGAPRFFLAMSPELPDPAFAKIVVLTPDAEAREALKHRLRTAVAEGLAPEAYLRITQLVFGPYTPFPVEFRVMGPDAGELRRISEQALAIMRAHARRAAGQSRLGRSRADPALSSSTRTGCASSACRRRKRRSSCSSCSPASPSRRFARTSAPSTWWPAAPAASGSTPPASPTSRSPAATGD